MDSSKASQRRIPWLLVAGSALILAAVGVRWFLENFDRRPVEIRSGFSIAARQNPFLALEYFLGLAGHTIESVRGRQKLADLPPSTDVLLLNNAGVGLAPERVSRLVAWVESGGHLIVTAVRAWDARRGASGDVFLDQLGVRLEVADFDFLEPAVAAVEADPPRILVNFTDTTESAEVGFIPSRYMTDGSGDLTGGVSTAAAEDATYHVMQYARGEGMITVTSDNQFLKNGQLADFDHAYFIALLIGAPQAKVWLLYDVSMPSLLELLWTYARMLLIAAGVFLFVLVWSRTERIGTIRVAGSAARRDVMQGMLSNAAFMWRHKLTADLVAGSRDEIRDLWFARGRQREKSGEGELVDSITVALNESKVAVEEALTGTVLSERSLIDMTRSLQRIRQAILF